MLERKHGRKGSYLVEFTLVGIPTMLALVSITEMARGMWTYHTLAYAIREGTRFAVVKGQGCTTAPNTCGVAIRDVAARIQWAGIGLRPEDLQIRFQSAQGDAACTTLSACLADTTPWPPAGGNAPGLDISIRASYPFRSAVLMFWPGAGLGQGIVYPQINLGAASTDMIQF